jgi:hypothetical protein
MFVVPATVGVKAPLWPPNSVALVGDKLRLTVCARVGAATGFNTSETVAVLLGSAWLVAVKTTVCWKVMLAGAV